MSGDADKELPEEVKLWLAYGAGVPIDYEHDRVGDQAITTLKTRYPVAVIKTDRGYIVAYNPNADL